MRVLLTNDDGIEAEGLRILREIASDLTDDIWVVAPSEDRSGSARSLSLDRPMSLQQHEERVWSLTGTPSDCVIMGTRHLSPEPIDLILSGVNNGQNMADYIHYSGTVGAAMEGTLLGIQSIALSQMRDFTNDESITRWNTARTHAPDILNKLLNRDFPKGTLLNINFPNCESDEIAGSSITRQAYIGHGLGIGKIKGEIQDDYHLTFTPTPVECGEDTDVSLLSSRHISITPISLHLTDEDYYTSLKESWHD